MPIPQSPWLWQPETAQNILQCPWRVKSLWLRTTDLKQRIVAKSSSVNTDKGAERVSGIEYLMLDDGDDKKEEEEEEEEMYLHLTKLYFIQA